MEETGKLNRGDDIGGTTAPVRSCDPEGLREHLGEADICGGHHAVAVFVGQYVRAQIDAFVADRVHKALRCVSNDLFRVTIGLAAEVTEDCHFGLHYCPDLSASCQSRDRALSALPSMMANGTDAISQRGRMICSAFTCHPHKSARSQRAT